uniref:Uncharacterized protein n=1 Tax=Vespula pensylvanica TaxID=30213 RepID=A0A834N0H8_VESPE|nr:hypothetical protein H0235_017661 [Vespula pensylvanica]
MRAVNPKDRDAGLASRRFAVGAATNCVSAPMFCVLSDLRLRVHRQIIPRGGILATNGDPPFSGERPNNFPFLFKAENQEQPTTRDKTTGVNKPGKVVQRNELFLSPFFLTLTIKEKTLSVIDLYQPPKSRDSMRDSELLLFPSKGVVLTYTPKDDVMRIDVDDRLIRQPMKRVIGRASNQVGCH